MGVRIWVVRVGGMGYVEGRVRVWVVRIGESKGYYKGVYRYTSTAIPLLPYTSILYIPLCLYGCKYLYMYVGIIPLPTI